MEKLKKTPCSRIRYTRCITIIERANGKKEEISTRFHFLHGSLCARRIPIHATHRGAGTKGWRICGRLRRLALMRHATNEKRKEKKNRKKGGEKMNEYRFYIFPCTWIFWKIFLTNFMINPLDNTILFRFMYRLYIDLYSTNRIRKYF